MKRRREYGRIRVPGKPEAVVTNEVIAMYIAAQQQEIRRLQDENRRLTKPRILTPGEVRLPIDLERPN